MSSIKLEQQLQDYLQALVAQDVQKCLTFYTEDAVIHFMTKQFQGIRQITEWHQERFKNQLKTESVENFKVNGNQLSVEMVVTSKRLKAWRINTVLGKGTFQFNAEGKIVDARFALATPNFYEGR